MQYRSWQNMLLILSDNIIKDIFFHSGLKSEIENWDNEIQFIRDALGYPQQLLRAGRCHPRPS